MEAMGNQLMGRWELFYLLSVVIKYYDQNQHGEGRGYFSLWLIVHHPGRPGRKSREEPGDSNSCRGHRGVLFTGLFLTACSACFLIQPRASSTAYSELSAPVWIMDQENVPQACPLWWGHFLSWSSLFQNDSSLCQLDNNTNQHRVDHPRERGDLHALQNHFIWTVLPGVDCMMSLKDSLK